MYRNTVFTSAAQRDAFADDVLEMLYAKYALEDGTIIEGQSLTHLQQLLRDPHRGSASGRKWVLGGGYHGITSGLEEAGFKIIRARTMRYTRNGHFKPYQMCDVVTL